MATIESLSPDLVDEPDPDPTYLSVDDAGPMLEALSSETARSIVLALSDGPATSGALADRIGSSIQNVSYHLSNLTEAGLVTVVGTRYSEKGFEMNVYARAVTALVIGSKPTPDERVKGSVPGSRPTGH